MLSLKHLKIIFTISIIIICVVLIKKNESFFNREEITDSKKTDFIKNMLSFGNQPEIYKDEIRMYKVKNSSNLILENISKFERIDDFRYIKNYSIFNKKLFFQKIPLVNINTIYSGYIITNSFKSDLDNKRYGFCIQLHNNKDQEEKLKKNIENNITEFSVIFNNKTFSNDLKKIQEIKEIIEQKNYKSLPRITINLFTKYNCPYEYIPYFKKGDDGEKIQVLGKFLGSNNLDFINELPDGKFNILDSNLNPILTGCEIDIPFCNIHLEENENIKGRDDIVPGIFSHKDGKYVIINNPEYEQFKKEKRDELIKDLEKIKKPKLQKLINNPNNFMSSKHQFLDLSKITDEENNDIKLLFEAEHKRIVQQNIDFYKSKDINLIPQELYRKLEQHNPDLIVKYSLIPNNNNEAFTNMLLSAHNRYQNMNSHFTNNIENFQDNTPQNKEYKGKKYITYSSFRECRKKENKDIHLSKFVNGEYTIIEDKHPIIKKDKKTVKLVRELSGIKCRKFNDKNVKNKFYYGGINEDGTPECLGEEGYCELYDSEAKCELENDNVAEGFENPESISQKIIKNNCQNFYINHKINKMYYRDVYKTKITNNKNIGTENVFLTLHKNYEISFDCKLHSLIDSDYKFSNFSKQDFINKDRIWHSFGVYTKLGDDEKLIEKFNKIGKNITMADLNQFNTLYGRREVYGNTFFYLLLVSPGLKFYKEQLTDPSKILGDNTHIENLRNMGFFNKINDVNPDITDEELVELNKVVYLNTFIYNPQYQFPNEQNPRVRRDRIWAVWDQPTQYLIDDGLIEKDNHLINNGYYFLKLDEKISFKVRLSGDLAQILINDGNGYNLLYQRTILEEYRLVDDDVNLYINQLDHFRISNFKYQKLPDTNQDEVKNDKCNQIMNEKREISKSKMTPGINVETFSNLDKKRLNYHKIDKNFNDINFMNCRYDIKNESLCKHVDLVKIFDYNTQSFKIKTRNLVELLTFKKCVQEDFISIITNNKNLSLSEELEKEIENNSEQNNVPIFLQDDIKKFELNKPIDYLIEPCSEGLENIHPGFLFEELELKFKIEDKKVEILKNNINIGYILSNDNNPYVLSSGDNLVLYIDKKNKLNVQILNENGTKSALKILNIKNKFGDEMNLILRSNNTNIFQNIYYMEQQKNIKYPYDPFIQIES